MSRETKTTRTRRTPIHGRRSVLDVQGKDPNYVYRIVNDTGDRIQQFMDQGYEIVSDNSIQVGDRRIANPTKEGSPIQISVGSGLKAFLMRQRKEFYDEDQQAKADYVDRTEGALKADAKKAADFGKVEVDNTNTR